MNTATSFVEHQITDIVDGYLSMLDTTAGYLTHVSTILASGIAENSKLTDLVNSASVPSQSAASKLNEYYKWVLDPNIDGIPIHASTEKCTRHVDTAEKLALSLEEDDSEEQNMHKNYVVDNAVPHLREWSVEGYITTIDPASIGLILKQDLQLKIQLLDAYAGSRRPVLYKTYDCRFYKVLITDFEYEQDPKVMNGIKVSLTLKEFKTIDIRGDTANNFPLLRAIKQTAA